MNSRKGVRRKESLLPIALSMEAQWQPLNRLHATDGRLWPREPTPRKIIGLAR